MKSRNTIITLLLLSIFIFGCNLIKESVSETKKERPAVEMVTSHGTLIIELYNETPLHRDNFIKLVKEGTYDSLLFHRVIGNFMIQGGDPDSKYAKPQDTIGMGGLGYKVKAEFRPNLFHKKGSLAAARDGNPERASSAIQFYIVQGRVLNDSLLHRYERRINEELAKHYSSIDPKFQHLRDSLQKARDDENRQRFTYYKDSLDIIARNYGNFTYYTIPKGHRKVYKTIGGTPHLDQNYTVYGEVVKGLDVVDTIAALSTGVFNRPLTDVRILSMRLLEN